MRICIVIYLWIIFVYYLSLIFFHWNPRLTNTSCHHTTLHSIFYKNTYYLGQTRGGCSGFCCHASCIHRLSYDDGWWWAVDQCHACYCLFFLLSIYLLALWRKKQTDIIAIVIFHRKRNICLLQWNKLRDHEQQRTTNCTKSRLARIKSCCSLHIKLQLK